MPNWLGPMLVLCGLVGFIFFAFRQGTKVKPDPNNTDNWPTNTAGGGDGGSGSGHP